MKKVVNKTVLAVILVLSMLVALCCGLFTIGQNKVAEAADKAVTVKLEADTTSFSKGTSFKLKITVTPTIADNYLDSLTLQIGALTSDKTVFDTTKCGYFTFTPIAPATALMPFVKSANIAAPAKYKDSSHIVKEDTISADGFLVVSIAKSATGKVKSNEVLTFEITANISNDVPDGTEFEIGVKQLDSSMFTYRKDTVSDSEYITANDSARFEIQPLTFTVKEPSNISTLDALKLGQGDTEADLTAVADLSDPANLSITAYDITKPLSVFPTLTDGNAKIELLETSAAAGSGTAAEGGKVTKFDIPADGKVRIVVTAENGTDKTEYVVTVKMVGAKLTALTATPDSATAGATKGLKETFDSSTFAYTVSVPSDSTKVTINATLSTGNSADTDVHLRTTGSCAVASTDVASATDFDVTGIANNDTLTIVARATDSGTDYDKDYVVTFKVLDVDTETTLTVKGTTTNKEFTNNTAKATEAGVDFYYVVAGETNASCSVTVTSPTTAAEVKLDGAVYTAAKTLTEGDHTVSVKAEAGNTKEYKFKLKGYTAIKLKTGITATFLHLKEDAGKQFRKTYASMGWKHGVDDLTLDKFVIGNIKDYTTVNSFLSNFDVDKSTIKLYNKAGTLVYDCGTAVNDFTEADLDSVAKPVGTGWKLEYVVGGKTEETIYLSVLGDLTGDGIVNALDINEISGIIKNLDDSLQNFEKLEVKLAAYIENVGVLPGSNDIATVGLHIQTAKPLSEMFTKNA